MFGRYPQRFWRTHAGCLESTHTVFSRVPVECFRGYPQLVSGLPTTRKKVRHFPINFSLVNSRNPLPVPPEKLFRASDHARHRVSRSPSVDFSNFKSLSLSHTLPLLEKFKPSPEPCYLLHVPILLPKDPMWLLPGGLLMQHRKPVAGHLKSSVSFLGNPFLNFIAADQKTRCEISKNTLRGLPATVRIQLETC